MITCLFPQPAPADDPKCHSRCQLTPPQLFEQQGCNYFQDNSGCSFVRLYWGGWKRGQARFLAFRSHYIIVRLVFLGFLTSGAEGTVLVQAKPEHR